MYSRYRSFVLRHLTFYLLGYGLLLIIGTLLTTASQMSGLNFAGNVLQYLGGVCLITVINFSSGSFFRKLILVAGIVMTMVEVKVGGIFVVHPTFSILGMFLVAAGIVTMLLVLFSLKLNQIHLADRHTQGVKHHYSRDIIIPPGR